MSGGNGHDRPIDPRKATQPYSVLVGLAFLAFVVFISINLLNSSREGARGLEPGSKMPLFAAPSATGQLEGDANVFQNKVEAGKDHVPACEVDLKDAIRICDFFKRPLVMVAWFTRCGNCKQQLDIVERVRHRFPRVGFLGLDIRDSHDNARKLVEQHHWGFPMALDRDGAVSALYRVGVGPTTFFAYPGGVVMDTALGELTEQKLVERVRLLVARTRARERKRRAA